MMVVRALDENVGNSGRIARPGRLSTIDLDIDVQAVFPQDDAGRLLGVATITDEGFRGRQAPLVAVGKAHLEPASVNDIGDDVGTREASGAAPSSTVLARATTALARPASKPPIGGGVPRASVP